MPEQAVAIDIGGTFTDLVAVDSGGRTRTRKVPTDPADLSRGVIEVLEGTLAPDDRVSFFVHGTTAGLNALLERRFQPVGLLTTQGFRDVYEIARTNRTAMYDLHYHRPPPLVSRRHRLEVRERIAAGGEVLVPLDEAGVLSAADQLVEAGIRSLAIVLLHAYKNPAHELRCEELIGERHPDLAVSLSHRVANEWREYERTSTTVVNAAIAGVVDTYLSGLERRLASTGVRAPVHVMQSNGGMTTAARARLQPINTLLSGPVGGAIAASRLAQATKRASAIAIDMGGTSFDVSLCIDGRPQIAREADLEGQPLILPVIDVKTIGAGGGSVAWEAAGGLRVGPRSAGAEPGPAAYGHGGSEPTVTDANVHLRRINPEYFLGGRMSIVPELAEQALERLAGSLGMDSDRLAEGILQVINSRMASLIRQITVGRGLDPRSFTLVAFGGAGPMHAAFLAEEMGIDTVLVPHSPGTFSAQGMLEAELRYDLVTPHFVRWDSLDLEAVSKAYEEMRLAGESLIREDSGSRRRVQYLRSMDLRYVGQEYFVTLAVAEADSRVLRDFHRVYRKTFGHANPQEMVEVVNLRLAAVSPSRRQLRRAQKVRGEGAPRAYARQRVGLRGEWVNAPRHMREELGPGDRLQGPCIVDESSCTTVVPDGWTVEIDADSVMRLLR